MGGRIPRQWLNVQVADAEDWASMGIWEQRFLHQGWTLSLPAPSPWSGLLYLVPLVTMPRSPGQSRGRAHPTITPSSPLSPGETQLHSIQGRMLTEARLSSRFSPRSLWNCSGSRARDRAPQGHLGFWLNSTSPAEPSLESCSGPAPWQLPTPPPCWRQLVCLQGGVPSQEGGCL